VNYVVRHVRRQVPRWHMPGAISFKAAVTAGLKQPLASVDVGPEDLAFLQYTGGTTGVAKGAMLSHGNVSTNVLQAEAWLGKGFDEPAVLITAIPLYHIFALSANCMLFARLGWKNVLIINPRDLPALIADMRKYPCSFISGVNTLFNALLHAPGFDKLDFSRLKITLGGGMAVQATVAQRWKEVTGNILTQAWGLTETSPAACINPPSEPFNGSIGLPISSTEIAIKDDAGNDLELGQIGEICVRGPQVMRGYWNRADETAKVMLPGGWLRTGDVGTLDERGFFTITDRIKDVIKSGGEWISSVELESAIMGHPKVLEAAVIGVPHPKWQERPVAYVVAKPDFRGAVTQAEIIEFLTPLVAKWWLPDEVRFVDEIPKTSVGKFDKKVIREQALKSPAAAQPSE
jgi:long-chain acyl-CoA synthetase